MHEISSSACFPQALIIYFIITKQEKRKDGIN